MSTQPAPEKNDKCEFCGEELDEDGECWQCDDEAYEDNAFPAD